MGWADRWLWVGCEQAGRDLGYLAGMMMASLGGCCCFVLIGQRMGMGLVANWWSLVVFQFVSWGGTICCLRLCMEEV